MADGTSPSISSRKEPKQARSEQLVADILTAAAQVLARDGARHFTTARVAEKAGVSIGSLYQYFPNKAAILFRLQKEEWDETGGMLRDILEDRTLAPRARLRALVHAFVHSECEEAALRLALSDAAPLYRHAPEARAPRVAGTRAMATFLDEALPGLATERRIVASEIIIATLSALGKRISEQGLDPTAVAARSEAVAEMLCGYFDRLAEEG